MPPPATFDVIRSTAQHASRHLDQAYAALGITGAKASRIPDKSSEQLMLSDRLSCSQILRHFQMMSQRRKGLARPILQFGILAALGIALKQ